MSKRDGKMYVARRLVTEADSTAGSIRMAHGDIAGVLYVYWTKNAARKFHGKNVELIEIRKKEDETND